MRFSWLLVWLALAFAVGWPLLTSLESLWVDELHSAWVIDGPWNEVASRAAIGNQSSLYFGCLKLFRDVASTLTSTFEWSLPSELLLRLFSWLGWVAMIGFVAYQHRHRSWTILILSMWLWLDRIGSFYAIETRPYIWVAFLSLLLMNSAIPVSKTPHKIHWLWLLWAVLMFYSHYTSLIVIALSMCGIFIDIYLSLPSCERFRLRSIIQSRVFDAFIFLGFAAPGLFYLVKIGEGSQQWNSFAGDQSFRACFGLFPWFAWCCVPALFLTLERVWVGLSSNTSSLQPTRFKSWEKNQGWLIQASVIGLEGC